MSGSIGLSSLPLTDAEKVDIRRFTGYPVYGGPSASGFQSWRYFQNFGTLEFRMNNLAPAEIQVVRKYLAAIYPLEDAIPAASSNLDTDRAAVWFHNRNEIQDRSRLFSQWCRRLCSVVGVPVGPEFAPSGGPGSVAMIV